MLLRKINKEFLVIIGVYIILTILVWGLFALDRGMWWDDIYVLSSIQAHSGYPFKQLFGLSFQSPTRIFLSTPFAPAQWSGAPIPSMQFLYGLAWFFTGLFSCLIIKEMFPSRPWMAYFAGALTLTATGDASMNSLSVLAIQFSVLYYFAALFFLLKWWHRGGKKWIFISGSCLLLNLWTYDAALPSILMTPILLWVIDEFRLTRRLIKAMIFWYALITPYLIIFLKFLLNPIGYAAKALIPMAFGERVIRTIDLFINNFTPWTWASRHWFPAPLSLLPVSFKLILSIAGTIIFLCIAIWLLKKQTKFNIGPINIRSKLISVGIVCLFMTITSNLIFSTVQFSEFYLRTQFVSSVWASIAISIFSYWLGSFILKRPYISLFLPIFFIGFGIYSGLERQDYYLGYWRQHKAELRSIVEQVPGLKPDARLILYVPPKSTYLATEATYLARCWISYLYNREPSLCYHVFLWSKGRNTSCKFENDAFVCIGEEKEKEVLPIAKSILFIYSPSQNRYILQKKIPTSLLQDASLQTDKYSPLSQIVNKPLPDYARSILYGPEYLGALFHSKNTLTAEDEIILLKFDSSKVNNNLRAGSIDLLESDCDLQKIQIISVIHAAGWAFDPKIKKPAKFVVILDNGKPFFKIPVNIKRKDVALTLKNSDLLTTGWFAIIPAEKIGEGKHRLEFYAMLLDGSFAPLQNNKGVTYIDIEIL